jgi:hypothetical protein
MTISINQQVDFLWKKLGYGVAKTEVPGLKDASNESIISSPFIPGNKIWVETTGIPPVIPTTSTTIVTVTTVPCVMDITSTDYRTWLTGFTDWVPIDFGSTYLVKVFLAPAASINPQVDGIQLFSAGTNNNDEWFFDYEAGVLHFIGTNLPNHVFTGQKIFISGARYTGVKGLGVLSTGTFGNLSFSGYTMSSSGNIVLDPASATGNVSVSNATITNVGYPVNNTDAASKQYVIDSLSAVHSNAITQGDSLVSVTDTGVGQVAIIVDGTTISTINSTQASFANLTITGNTLSSTGDLVYAPAAGKVFTTASTTAIKIPVGTSADRPVIASTGFLRYNTTYSIVEYYNGTEWVSMLPITDTQLIVGDNTTTNYSLNHSSTANNLLVTVNGVVQTPNMAYTVTGSTIAFNEPPLDSEIVVIRFASVSMSALATTGNTTVLDPTAIPIDLTASVLDTFNFGTYRSAKYTLSETYPDGNAQMHDIMVTHNGFMGIGTSVDALHDVRSTSVTGSGTGALTFNAYAWAGMCVLTAYTNMAGTIAKIQKTYFTI